MASHLISSSSKFSTLIGDLRTWPSGKQWLACLSTTALLLIGAWFILPDFVDLSHRPSGFEMMEIAAIAFFFPALCEELVFRGLLNPTQTPLSISISTALFVAWHPLGGWLFLPQALDSFIDPRFLFFAAMFGISFCLMRKFTGSLWAPIFCHWLVVLIWKALGGAQFLTN